MLSSGGQSLEDKLYAVKYFISGQALSLVVLKATTSEMIGPKKKHLNYLVNLTNEPNVSIPNLVKYLMRRARHQEWTTSFKAIITIHYLTCYGNEKFIQNLASSNLNNRSFDYLGKFNDRSTSQSLSMSPFVRKYSRYVNTKILTYRSLGTDFCHINKTLNHQQTLRYLSHEQLLHTIPILQNQFDLLLAFDATAKDLNNGVINSAFLLLYKDFVKLYIAYQTAIIRLLEAYFNLSQPKKAKELLDIYKKFLVRMDTVSDFVRVVDSVGINKSDIPNVSRAPSLALKMLESRLQHLQSISRRPSHQVAEVPRVEYATLGRRRSLRSQQQQQPAGGEGAANSVLSPTASRIGGNNKRRVTELGQLVEESPGDKRKKEADDEGRCDVVSGPSMVSSDLSSGTSGAHSDANASASNSNANVSEINQQPPTLMEADKQVGQSWANINKEDLLLLSSDSSSDSLNWRASSAGARGAADEKSGQPNVGAQVVDLL